MLCGAPRRRGGVVREVGRRWHPLWDINVAARTKDWFAALCTARSYGQLASLNAPEAVIALVDRKEAVPLNWT